jgi:GYF domain 2
MKESAVDPRDAEPIEPSWYLCREGQQHGPLTDRELSLFADGGNFRPDDLLWTAGLDGWKPAHAVFGLKKSAPAGATAGPAKEQGPSDPAEASFKAEPASEPIEVSGDGEDAALEFVPSSPDVADDIIASDIITPDVIAPDIFTPDIITPDVTAPDDSVPQDAMAQEAVAPAAFEGAALGGSTAGHDAIDHDTIDHEAVEPHVDDVSALVQALKGEAEPAKLTLKERAIEELKAFAGAFIYLWVVFTVLLLHEWLVLADHHIGFAFYGLATLNALGLGKIMIIAEHFRFAERLREKPLMYPIAYKTVAFTTLLFVAYALEMMLIGWIGGHGFAASAPALGGSVTGTLALWLVFCAALMPYFAFKELERAVGRDMIRKLLFGAR